MRRVESGSHPNMKLLLYSGHIALLVSMHDNTWRLPVKEVHQSFAVVFTGVTFIRMIDSDSSWN